jgi:hypothetical protein
MKKSDPVAASFDRVRTGYNGHFEEGVPVTDFNFQQRLTFLCELGAESAGAIYLLGAA